MYFSNFSSAQSSPVSLIIGPALGIVIYPTAVYNGWEKDGVALESLMSNQPIGPDFHVSPLLARSSTRNLPDKVFSQRGRIVIDPPLTFRTSKLLKPIRPRSLPSGDSLMSIPSNSIPLIASGLRYRYRYKS